MITWDKKAAQLSKHQLKQYWNEVEVISFKDKTRKTKKPKQEYRKREESETDW